MSIMFNLKDIVSLILLAILAINGLILLGYYLWHRLKNKFKKKASKEGTDENLWGTEATITIFDENAQCQPMDWSEMDDDL